MGKLTQNFSFTFPAKVWDTSVSSDGSILVVEVRNDIDMSAFFYVLDLVTFKFLHEELSFEEKWWIGISSVEGGSIVFHTYDGQNPDDKSYFLFDIENESMVKIEESTSSILIEVKKNNPVDLPFHYVDNTDYFNTVQKFILGCNGHKAERAIDYYESENRVIVSYYYSLNDKLANNLLVVNMSGEIVFEETLGKQLAGISDHSFFINKNSVIFVKDSIHFLIYNL